MSHSAHSVALSVHEVYTSSFGAATVFTSFSEAKQRWRPGYVFVMFTQVGAGQQSHNRPTLSRYYLTHKVTQLKDFVLAFFKNCDTEKVSVQIV